MGIQIPWNGPKKEPKVETPEDYDKRVERELEQERRKDYYDLVAKVEQLQLEVDTIKQHLRIR